MVIVFVVRKKLKWRNPKGKKRIPAAGPRPSFPPWTDLPRDVTANILQRLGVVEILKSAQQVCTTWWRVAQEPSLWRVIDTECLDFRQIQIDYKFCGGSLCRQAVDLCRQAVDRSRGELIDINIEDFGSDDLLNYISDRSSNLRRLSLVCCAGVSSKGLVEAVKKFPELEDLHLFFMPLILAADIETIGMSCPMLKSFTFNDRGYRFSLIEVNDDYALAIGKTMPNLRHLRLIGNRMRNEGLQAILDGCPHLESLDLRRCFCVDLTGDLGKRCSEQMKNLRRPSDSYSDCKWDTSFHFGDDDHGGYGWNESTDDGDDDNYSIGDYDDYSNPFNIEYLSDNGIWFFDHDEYL